MAGEFVPGGGSRRSQMIDAGGQCPAEITRNGQRRHIGDQFRRGWRALLVSDDIQAVPFRGQPQYGFDEIAAMDRKYPTGAEDQRIAAAVLYGGFARAFGFAIDALRVGVIGFGINRGLAAVKHIIRRVMHQQRAAVAGPGREHPDRFGVDAKRGSFVALGLVDSGVCRGIDDDPGGVRRQHGFQSRQVLQIGGSAAQRDNCTQRLQGALQFMADLTVFAQQQDFHGMRVFCADFRGLHYGAWPSVWPAPA